jgi:hypothetical protein
VVWDTLEKPDEIPLGIIVAQVNGLDPEVLLDDLFEALKNEPDSAVVAVGMSF